MCTRHNPAVNTDVARQAAQRRLLLRWAPMKAIYAALVMVSIVWSTPTSAEGQCVAAGEAIQWIADYCLLKMQTDDEIAVSDCIEEERKKPFPTSCASNLNFKKGICVAVIRNGTKADTVDQCMKDPTFKGRTVKAGGVGA